MPHAVRSRVSRGVLALFAAGASAAASWAAEPDVPATVSTSWLAEHLGPSVAIVDARPALKDYLAGHLPGAQLLGVENVRSASGGIPGEMFPAETIAVIAGRLGLERKGPTIVYSEENDPDATWVATALRSAGFERVGVLDGGIKRWIGQSLPVTSERPAVRRSTPRAAPVAVLANREEVLQAVHRKSAVIVDARPPEQFDASRIPGAVNRFWRRDIAADGESAGLFRDAKTLAEEYAALGVTRDKPVIVYCNSGHQASQVFWELRYRLGYPNVKLYDGSMLEWSADPSLPKESTASR